MNKQKKQLSEKYNPKEFEDKLYKHWEESGYFKPNMDPNKEAYCIMMPPPNVTGKLHMGHALDGTLQDILIRFKRMQGYNTLWLPGSDHASISTEMKVVQKLQKEGKTKADLGREKFIEEAWEWTHLYGGTIQKQQRKIGCSCDWDRRRFTLDEGLSDAVLEQFIRLYQKGLIYRGERMVNWCTNCNTSISDAEVIYQEEETCLWYVRYPIVGEKDRFITIATTRPETMLGDTAVAVHPDDPRYQDVIGKKCMLPIMNKEIPIIADEFVEKEFGTGAVKITPCHDMNDYQAGLKHHLEMIQVFDEHFKMGDLLPEYKGMDLLEARQKIVERLKQEGYLIKEEKYMHNVGKCERCKHTIEPKISTQWFVKMKELAEPAIKAVENGDIKFIPKKYEKTYFNWMYHIQDWCISRQLWWGHQIPAYYCKKCGHIHVAKEAPKACEKCGGTELYQDPDTLDTWFSSALWPFSTLGWPDENAVDLKTFYPTNVLITGYDIIFFWVARMIFSGLDVMGERPFKDVLIHGIVRDSQGRKMSKTLGNGIDPIEVIDQYSADALRFSLLTGTTMGNDIRYMPEKLEQASNFANKIWNAAKFILMNQPEPEKLKAFRAQYYDAKTDQYQENAFAMEDKWILHQLNELVAEITTNIEHYDMGVAIDKIYNFMWNEFCDWYIEMAKLRLYADKEEAKIQVSYVLSEVFKTCLKLLHPFMPFVTSEIYDALTDDEEKELMVSDWPVCHAQMKEWKQAAELIQKWKKIIVEIRNIRNTKNIHPTQKSDLILVTKKYTEDMEKMKDMTMKFGFAKKVLLQETRKDIPEDAIQIVTDGIEVYMPMEGLIDKEAEKQRLEAEKTRLEAEVARCEKMLANKGFMAKAPASKIAEEKEKLAKYQEMLQKVKESL